MKHCLTWPEKEMEDYSDAPDSDSDSDSGWTKFASCSASMIGR